MELLHRTVGLWINFYKEILNFLVIKFFSLFFQNISIVFYCVFMTIKSSGKKPRIFKISKLSTHLQSNWHILNLSCSILNIESFSLLWATSKYMHWMFIWDGWVNIKHCVLISIWYCHRILGFGAFFFFLLLFEF